MLQTSLFQTRDASLEAAIHLIKPYVLRGDNEDYLKDMGAGSPQSYSVSIGFYMNGKKVGNDKIAVARDMDGNEVNKVYNKKDIIKMIREEYA